MKKLIMGVFVFSIVAISMTGILINLNNNISEIDNSSIVSGNKENGHNIENKSSFEKEKTLDLYGFYDENDLEILEKTEMVEVIGKEISIPYIKGLKNKEVEEKVNCDIKNRIIECIGEVPKKDGVSEIDCQYYFSEYYHDYSNFSNIISFYGDVDYKINEESFSHILTFNYELVNGERLKFEDLFKNDTDIHSIVRKIFYRSASKNVETGLGEIAGDIYYDKEENIWKYKAWEWNENGEDYEIEVEYIPPLTEYDINKMIMSFINEDDNKFYFSPTSLYLVMNENNYSYYIYLKDIANEVVIYDKYLTEESLYEASNIGRKNIWTCAERTNSEYIDYGFAEYNLYYEVSYRNYYNISKSDYPFKKSVNKLKEEVIKISKAKIEEYKKIAKENLDKFYVLYIGIPIDYSENEEYNYLLTSKINEYLSSTDIKNKEEIMTKILDAYRYHNLGFYNSALELSGFLWNQTIDSESLIKSFEKNEEQKIYDARNLKEISSIDEVFKNDVDYMSVIKTNLKQEIMQRKNYNLIEEEVNELVEKSKYNLSLDGIEATVPGFDYKMTIFFSEFDKSILKIYDLGLYIIPESSIRQITKEEIQNLSLDELNKAYNEIFARYGHDFNNKELKEYFNLCNWYNPIINKSVSLEELNEIERYNLDIIKSVINEKK